MDPPPVSASLEFADTRATRSSSPPYNALITLHVYMEAMWCAQDKDPSNYIKHIHVYALFSMVPSDLDNSGGI